jgi:hypothetical protein
MSAFFTSRQLASRRLVFGFQRRVSWRLFSAGAIYVVLWRGRDARRRISSVVSNNIRRFTFTTRGVYWRRRLVFQRLVLWGIPRFIVQIWRIVALATLGVGFPTSPKASSGSALVTMASFGGVATLGAGFPASCPMTSRGSPAPNMAVFTRRRDA